MNLKPCAACESVHFQKQQLANVMDPWSQAMKINTLHHCSIYMRQKARNFGVAFYDEAHPSVIGLWHC